jgi:hypothetical protein
MENDITIDEVDMTQVECFTITPRLRWENRVNPDSYVLSGYAPIYERVLQQMWQGDKGSQIWKDVETYGSE